MNLTASYSCNDKSMYYEDEDNGLKHIGFLSLKVALENYFNTYSSIKDRLVNNESYGFTITECKDIQYNNQYCKACSETIVHFQHFFELIIKEILEKESPLLAVRANKNNVVFHKLIKGEKIVKSDYDKLYSIEFSEALDTINDLLKEKRIDEKFIFFKDKRDILVTLNNFRNRTWHRGMFLLRYDALDEFVGKYLLPLVRDIIDKPEYSKYKDIFMFDSKNYINIEIINELIEENKLSRVDSGKIALLKEMGRASYILKDRYDSVGSYESIIEEEGKWGFILNVQKCPVCGKPSLVLRCDNSEDVEELFGDTGNYMSGKVQTKFESDVKCMNCSFQVNKYVENLRLYNIPFEDFWRDYNILD